MHVVVIQRWGDAEEPAQAVAEAVGITVFEARQRLGGDGPAVVAGFGDPAPARGLAERLERSGLATLVVDSESVRGRVGRIPVRRFDLGEAVLRIETDGEEPVRIPWGDVDLLLPATRIAEQTGIKTVTERKFSLGKTILSGGIPMTSKVERQEEVTTEEREKVLFLYAGDRPQIVFSQSVLAYDGLGAAMQMSRELNFAYVVKELRRLATGAAVDERLLTRPVQARLLGPAQNLANGLDLAAEIVARSLRRKAKPSW